MKYAPTVNPGDTRRRVWFMGIRNTLGSPGAVEVREEEVIRKADGTEKSLGATRDMSLSYTPELGQVPLQLRSPVDDSVLPNVVLPIDLVYAAIYTLARYIQELDDAKQQSPSDT
jgi:hypothetical protein